MESTTTIPADGEKLSTDMAGRIPGIRTTPETYIPSEATLELFKRYCGLAPEDVRQRVLDGYQAGITRGFPFRCIQEFRFIEPRIAHHPFYSTLCVGTETGAVAGRPSFLDIGCCMGTDIRQMLASGAWLPEQVLGVDLQHEFLNIGMDIVYQDRPTMQDRFLAGNILDDDDAIWRDARLQGQTFDFVYTGSVLHLLDQGDIEKFVSVVSHRLLKPGGMFLGRTAGWADDAGYPEGQLFTQAAGQLRYLHSSKSLQMLLESQLVEVQIQSNNSELLPKDDLVPVVMMSFQGKKLAA